MSTLVNEVHLLLISNSFWKPKHWIVRYIVKHYFMICPKEMCDDTVDLLKSSDNILQYVSSFSSNAWLQRWSYFKLIG